MMATPSKKTLSPNVPSTKPPPAPTSRNSPSRSSSSINGVGRSTSLRGGPGLARPPRGGASHRSSPQTSFLSMKDEGSDDDARAEHVSLMDELRNRVQKAETASEELQRQLNLLQARLDESLQEQGTLEDRLHQSDGRIEELKVDHAMAMRKKREMEDLYETERMSLMQEKTEQKAREEELVSANQRLKETLAQREARNNSEENMITSRKASVANGASDGNETGQFAPPSSTQPSNSKDHTKLVMQKDRVIESLRLELAEAQIKMMEMDSSGGGKIHELEKSLLETRITNARLMEDNESFQLLLSEKTLNGDFSKTDAMNQSSKLGSLAEELGSEELEPSEPRSDDYRRLELETKSLKDQNKALALYIENIIGRLLQHQEFENILDKTPDLMSGAPRPQAADTQKELPPPPPPPPKDEQPAPSILQRARSVVAGPSKRPRPVSQLPPTPSGDPPPMVLPDEDRTTAPSVPLARSQSTRTNSHRRSQSDFPGAAPIVNQMYRGPPSFGSGGPITSPGISPGVSTATRNSFFGATPASAASSNAATRAPSGSRSRDGNPGSSSNSTFSDHSGGVDGEQRSGGGVANNYTGAVMTQNRLRPLRLVQEHPVKEEDAAAAAAATAARKKANRGSWMPAWMGAPKSGGNENAPS